jgi:hypothetical protein
VAGGYKYTLIKDYFKKKNKKVDIEVINTGLNSFTAKRLVKLKKKTHFYFYVNVWRWNFKCGFE